MRRPAFGIEHWGTVGRVGPGRSRLACALAVAVFFGLAGLGSGALADPGRGDAQSAYGAVTTVACW